MPASLATLTSRVLIYLKRIPDVAPDIR